MILYEYIEIFESYTQQLKAVMDVFVVSRLIGFDP